MEGVLENRTQDMVNNLVTQANNPQKLSPTHYLSAEVIDYEGKTVIYAYIPESSHVHNTGGKIFDRNEDGDQDITRYTDRVAQLVLIKHNIYTENQVFPYLKMSDFNQELVDRVRIMASTHRRDEHPWEHMSDEELIRSAGLYKHDPQSGRDGFTLAAALLLGKDETILNVLPHHRTDAVKRVVDKDRYDDRDMILTNLIDSYDRLMDFIRKHLDDPFYLEGDQRISIREQIFREVVGNMLIHREYTNAFTAKLVIEKERVLAENWNLPKVTGKIDPANFTPITKNPVIARFFREIGRADELGSGVHNIFKYTSAYSRGGSPELFEGDVFRTIIPRRNAEVAVAATEEENGGVNAGIGGVNEATIEVVISEAIEGVKKNTKERLIKLLLAIVGEEGKRTPDYVSTTSITERTIERHIKQLKKANLIEFRGDAPKTGGYYLTPILKKKLNKPDS